MFSLTPLLREGLWENRMNATHRRKSRSVSERVSVSKPVNFLRIKRSETRERLTAADVNTFEDEVECEQILCIPPNLKLTNQTILDKVKYLH